jgi:anaerobic selenocysteine-containing dehydrogenase
MLGLLDVPPAARLAPETVRALERFAAEVRDGLEVATHDPAYQARSYSMLRLQRTVRLDPELGLQLGRQHQLAVEREAALPAAHTKQSFKTMCPMNCHPTYCGMVVSVEDGTLQRISGDPDNPDSRGFLCLRGRAAHEIIGNPRRLERPLRRVGARGEGRWEPISWDAALDQIADRIRRAGRERVGIWPGHGAIVSGIGPVMIRRLGYLGGFQFWNPAIVCWALGGYGLQLTGVLEANTKEDLAANSRTVLFWGANLDSQPSTVPHLVAARRRGAQVIGIDVRRTATAQHADRFLVIRPGTDAALALGMMQVLVEERLIDRPFVEQHTLGFERLAETLPRYSPEWTAATTGLEPDTVRWLARTYAAERPAMIVLGGASMFKHRGGWLASRAIACLPALTGQLGIPGGGLGPRHRAFTHGEGYAEITGQHQRPPGDYIPSHMPEIARALREGRIEVLLLLGTNMLSSFADGESLAEGLGRVGLIVAHDLFSNATIRRYADLVLPGTSWLEEIGLKDTATHVYLMDQALEPHGEARSASRLVADLAARLELSEVFPWASQAEAADALLAGLDEGRVTVERLRREAGRYEKRISHVAYPDHRYHTPSGRVELFSARAEALGLPPLPVYQEPAESPASAPELAARYPLTFRQGRTFASFHGFYDEAQALPTLAKVNPGPELWISPADAAERGISQGDRIEIVNDRARVEARAKVTDDLPPGVVWMRDGWLAVNALTSNQPCVPPAASEALPIPGGQASYEALVEVRRAG